MKILHILDHYKPHFSGYVFRTASILRNQQALGLEPVIVTSPKHGPVKNPLDEIDGMRVYRTGETEFGSLPFVKEKRLMRALQERIEAVAEIEKPDIIHAHSPSLNGMPAVKAGRKLGIPVVYEVRAFWEDAAVDHGTFAEGSLKYRVSKHLETRLFRDADALFTICEGLKKDMVGRGIPADKITIIPNCVDVDAFAPIPYDEAIAERLGVRGKRVFGFIGSFYNYEGLELLLESFAQAFNKGMNACLLLVGGGPEHEAVSRKAEDLGLVGPVIITGKVPHEEVNRYYSVIDLLVYPRLSMRLTELVTPLKPLEAMAMGKVVLGSDVGGIKELVTHGHDGFLFKAGDKQALTELLQEIASGGRDLAAIAKQGMETVRVKHDWRKAVERYLPVYRKLAGKS
ncbi:MAG: glycosyl transferase group [Geobacteraceae bacterium]|nr:MAG: glycosyl transferase group [Geobacteraceae bacterium]